MNDAFLDKPEYVAVSPTKLKLVDAIVDKLKYNDYQTVESDRDWEAVVLMFELFKVEYPDHYNWFVEKIKFYRQATEDTHGIIKDDAGDSMQHQLEIPEGFHMYVHTLFPNQKWDKKFVRRLTKELPIFKVSDTL
jgi:hypothetical protein